MSINKKQRGFTIIEVLIVVMIIGILATLMLISYTNSLKKSRDAKRLSDIESVKLACNMYADKEGVYPDDTGDFAGLNLQLEDYIDIDAIADPLPDHSYTYTSDGTDCTLSYYSEIDGADRNVNCKD